MTGIFQDQDFGEFLFQYGKHLIQRDLVIGSMNELKNEIAKSISKGFMKYDPFEKFDPNDMSDSTTRRLIFIKM